MIEIVNEDRCISIYRHSRITGRDVYLSDPMAIYFQKNLYPVAEKQQ